MTSSKIVGVHKSDTETHEKTRITNSISSSNHDLKSLDDKALQPYDSALPGVKSMIHRLNENIVSSKNKKVSLRSVPSRKKVDSRPVDDTVARRSANTKSSRIQAPLKLGSLDVTPNKLSPEHKSSLKDKTDRTILAENQLPINACDRKSTEDDSGITDKKQREERDDDVVIDDTPTNDQLQLEDDDEDDMIIGPSSENAWVEGAVYQINYNNNDETLFFYAFVSLYSKSTLTFMPSGEVELAIQEGDCTPVQFMECSDGLAVGRPTQERGGGVIVRKMIQINGVPRPIFLFLPDSYPVEGLVISFIGHDTNDVVMKKVRSFLYYISEYRHELGIDEAFDPMRPNQRVSLFDLDDNVVQKLSTATCLWERMDIDSYRIWATYKSHTVTRKIKMDWFQAWLKTYSGRVSSPAHLERVAEKSVKEGDAPAVEWTQDQMKAAQQKIKKELKKRDGFTSKRKKP